LAALEADNHFADAHFHLAHLKNHDSSADDVERMKSLFASDATTPKEKAMLAYGIGKALDKQADYEQEFAWLERAHELQKSYEKFEPQANNDLFRGLRDTFTQHVIDDVVSDCDSHLLFVVGMPRSGTSLADQILASHADVFGFGERMLAAQAVELFKQQHGATSYPREVPTVTTTELNSIARSLLAALATDLGEETVIVDTTPSNFVHIGFLAMIFPRARFVLCTRHPLDVCLSIYQHPLSESHAYAHELSDLGGYYAAYQELVDHWTKVLGSRIFVQQYERVVGGLDDSVRALLHFCRLEFDPACIDFHTTERIVKTPSASQVRQPIYSSSIGRWRRYAKQLDPLKIQLEQALGTSLD